MASLTLKEYYSTWVKSFRSSLLQDAGSAVSWSTWGRAISTTSFTTPASTKKTLYNAYVIHGTRDFDEAIGSRCLNVLAWPLYICSVTKTLTRKTIDTLDRAMFAPATFSSIHKRESSNVAILLKAIPITLFSMMEAAMFPLAKAGDFILDNFNIIDDVVTKGIAGKVLNFTASYLIAPILGLTVAIAAAALVMATTIIAAPLLAISRLVSGIKSSCTPSNKITRTTTSSIYSSLGRPSEVDRIELSFNKAPIQTHDKTPPDSPKLSVENSNIDEGIKRKNKR
jgi:hypothetical protein